MDRTRNRSFFSTSMALIAVLVVVLASMFSRWLVEGIRRLLH
jgi:hypothetical protein